MKSKTKRVFDILIKVVFFPVFASVVPIITVLKWIYDEDDVSFVVAVKRTICEGKALYFNSGSMIECDKIV